MKGSAIIIGASKGLGKAMAYQLAANGINCLLAARSENELLAIADDIKTKYQITPSVAMLDLEKMDAEKAKQFVVNCFSRYKNINQVYITAAIADDNDYGTESLEVLQKTNDINYKGAALLATAFSKLLQDVPATIAVVSSVAAIRPRGRNISYAASKIALEYHVKSLRHFFADKLLRFHIYRVGYMDTDMSAGQNPPLKKARPEDVAAFIINNTKSKGGLYYYPRFWALIAIVLKMVPWFIYKRLKF